MAAHDEFSRLDIATLRGAYAAGSLTPEQLVQALCARMQREPLANVWLARFDEAALRARARSLGPFSAASPPLYGVPFAVKDNIDVAGLPTTAACPAFAYTPPSSAPTVQTLLDAGAICLGKVNMDQFATGLVGTRSPYGACANVFDPSYLSGGSSSGSALAVAAHQVSFSLGTDTAGSGRVPAALNNVVGLKPSVGLLSREGMVPACASLDCISVFAACVADAVLVRDLMCGLTRAASPRPASFRYGVPRALEFFGDEESGRVFTRALAHLDALGGERVEVDYAPFAALGDLLYGPFVVERHLAVGAFIEAHESDVLPITRDIILGARRFGAGDAFRAFQRLTSLRAACEGELARADVLVLPTVPRHFTLAAERSEPRAINDKLGIYTRFVNFIGCPVLAVPCDVRADGLPFGVSLIGRAGKDEQLDGLGAALHAAVDAGMGRARHALAASSAALRPQPLEARLAVVGAHLRGMPLHEQLEAVQARYVATVHTAPSYRLFALAGGPPERPGLLRVGVDGAAIEVELFDLSWHALGEFMRRVPPPLAIGSVLTADGELVKGFLCESYALEGARDISSFGGYRAYLRSRG